MGENEIEPLLDRLSGDQRRVFELIAHKKPLEEIAARIGLSEEVIEKIAHKARFAFGANDDLLHDYFRLIEEWKIGKDAGPYFECDLDILAKKPQELERPPELPKDVLEDLESRLSTVEMREVAQSLLHLADAMDQNWNPNHVSASYRWPSTAARIEKNSLELAKRAKLLLLREQEDEKHLPSEILNRPAWNMLLDLFIQFAGGAKVSVTSLSIAARCPATSALRYIALLENEGLIERTPSPSDGRVTLCSLTKNGVVSVGRILEQL